MKKRLLPLAVLAFSTLTAFAQYAPSAQTDVYDLAGFGDDILDLFYDALQQGRRYPTMAEFAAAGIDPIEINFVRSHVRPRPILLDHAKDVNPAVAEGRKLWMNLPLGIGKEQGGYPNSNFCDDTFTGWNYTHIFGSWNNGLFHAPSVLTDAGHKHGTDVHSGIKFFEGWTAGAQASGWVAKIQARDPKGYEGFKYVEPLINALMYFGQDGINYNFEDSGFMETDVVRFHQAAYKLAAERGFDNFHIGIYTQLPQLTASNCEALLGRDGVKTADGFLNYSNGDFATSIETSVRNAEKYYGSADGLYQGAWIVSMARKWNLLNRSETAKKMGIVLWGEHNESRIHSNTTGNDAVEFHENYQKLQDRFFSGGYRNPALRPAETTSANWQNENTSLDGLRTFQGLAEYVPERTALQQNLPFTTHFNTGAGERYNYKGKKTAGSWYNLGAQDYQPTYRWLVYKSGTNEAVTEGIPELTGADAYTGGNSLRLKGTENQDIVLYRGLLTCTGGNSTATLALKRRKIDGAPEGHVSVIVKKQGSNEWIETGDYKFHDQWSEMALDLKGIAQGDVIEYVGLRTKGDTDGILVGKLSLNDDSRVQPAAISDVVVDIKEETQVSLSVKMAWDVAATAKTRAANDLVYNDEAGIDHFEILYKNGENGRVSEVSRTTSWSGYVGNISLLPAEDGEEVAPYIGVRAASVDGKSYSEVAWVALQRADASQLPATSAATGGYPSSTLNNGSEGIGYALANRFITKFDVTGGDEAYSYVNNEGTPYVVDRKKGIADKNADKSNYILADDVLRVHQGQTLTCTLAYNESALLGTDKVDALNYCTARGYMDFDGDHNFNGGNDEVVWQAGKSNAKYDNRENLPNPVTFTFKVPDNATTGESRLRLVFSDAWFPHPGPAGVTQKGFSIDFPVEISGDNPGRIAIDIHDQGVADEPVDVRDAVGIHFVENAASEANFDGSDLRLSNVDQAWLYNAEGRLVQYVTPSCSDASISTRSLAPGTYVVRMQNGAVIRSTKFIVQ